MDKSCDSSGDSSREQYLKHLSKLSHKISKPTIKNHPPNQNNFRHPAAPPLPPQHQHQPPVYNINKNDFRNVVQKLTGSPAHERFSTPPPIHPPKPQSSRLQRIRPPPLAHVSNLPHPMLNCAAPNPPSFGSLSPLPPLPSVHAAAESPISAYMRYLHNSDPNPKHLYGFSPLSPLVSPKLNNQAPPQQATQFQVPSSPLLPFGCFNSPRSPYPLLSPGGALFSPSSGFPQFPLSPTVPVSSPRWRDL